MKSFFLLMIMFFSGTVKANQCNSSAMINKIFSTADGELNSEAIITELRTMDQSLISDVQKGKKFNYWVDDQNQIRFSEGSSLPKKDSAFIILQDQASQDGHMIKEWGNLSYNSEEKVFLFKAENSIDLQPGEIEEAISQNSKIKFIREANPALQKSQVVKCTDFLAAQERGDTFIKDGLMISGSVTVAGFVTSTPEILNVDVHDKNWQQNAKLLSSDLTSNLISSYITGRVVKPLLVKNASIYNDFFQRTGTDLATNYLIKRPLFNAVNSDNINKSDQKKMGDQLMPYDTGFGVVRFFPKRAVQKWTMKSLPKILMNSCLKNSKLNLIVGPRMVRLADQYVSGYFYMAGRKAWLKNQTEE